MSKKVLIGGAMVAAVAVAGYVGLQYYATAEAKEQVDAKIAEMTGGQGGIAYDDLKVSLITGSMTFKGVAVDSGTAQITADRLVMSDLKAEPGQQIPTAMNIHVDGVRIKPQQQTLAGDVMKNYGVTEDDTYSDIRFNYTFDEKTKKLRANIEQENPAFADFKLSVDLDEVTRASFSIQGSTMAQLAGVEVAYVDHGLYDMLLKTAARDQKRTPEAVQGDLSRFLEAAAAQYRQSGNERAAGVFDNFKRFAAKHGSLKIKASPEKPVILGRIISQASRSDVEVMETLKLDVKAN